MFRPRPPATASHGVRTRWALLVLAVLTGLLAMHGLSPATPASPASGPYAPHAPHASEDPCVHADSGHGGHDRHADSTCAAGAVGGGLALPAPTPAVSGAAAEPASAGHAPVPASGGRAPPPSLSELQLLRI
ncbi:DUF6153 family protein [Streptomyces sp. URMC 129]|uniref:DUF6153 family protein n=1 Tax=Streptomyces sp. URMC 129 TaxID=3423407 RepID=UPI003F1B0574